MALPDRDGDYLLLMMLMLLAEREGIDFEEFEPALDEILRRLERDVLREQAFPHLPRFFFERLRQSRTHDGSVRPRSRLRYKIDQIYSHVEGRFDQLANELDRRFSDLNDKLEETTGAASQQSYETAKALDKTNLSITRMADAVKIMNWCLSVGVPLSEPKSRRSIPVRIYTPDNPIKDVQASIINSIRTAMEALSFEIDVDLPDETGSWWKRLWMTSKDLITQEEVQERLIKIERIAETKLFDKPQAEANKDHAAAVATIMKSLEHVNSACVQIGNILLVKNTPPTRTKHSSAQVMVRTLNPLEMRALEKNQTILKDPARIIQKLEDMCSSASVFDTTPRLPPGGS